LEEPFSVGGAEAALTASMGVALSDRPQGLPEALVRLADLAMYRSKREGKGRISLHEASP
jgi:GGDEF domain-containing protein